MSLFPLKPTHKPVKDYYAALVQFNKLGHTTEGNSRPSFADLLKRCCRLPTIGILSKNSSSKAATSSHSARTAPR